MELAALAAARPTPAPDTVYEALPDARGPVTAKRAATAALDAALLAGAPPNKG